MVRVGYDDIELFNAIYSEYAARYNGTLKVTDAQAKWNNGLFAIEHLVDGSVRIEFEELTDIQLNGEETSLNGVLYLLDFL